MSVTGDLQSHRIQSLQASFYYIPDFISVTEEATLLAKIDSSTSRWTQLHHRRLQVYPTALTSSNVLLAQPLPQWLTNPILNRFEDLGVFNANEADHPGQTHLDDTKGSNVASTSNGTPHRAPNHVLINEYHPGQGIMPHEDGGAYAPVVATVSLGGHTVLDIYAKRDVADSKDSQSVKAIGRQIVEGGDVASPEGGETTEQELQEGRYDSSHPGVDEPCHRILQEPRSLLITRGDAYKMFLHGIADVQSDAELNGSSIANWDMLVDKSPYESGMALRETRVSLTFRDVVKVSKVGSQLFGRR